MKLAFVWLASLCVCLVSMPALACSVASPELFLTDDTGVGDPPPTPQIRVVEVSRATGRDQASCAYLGRLHFEVDNPGDYGLLFQVEGTAPFRFRNQPLAADDDIHYRFDDAETRGDNIDAVITVVPVSATGVLGEAVAVPVAAEADTLVACSSAGSTGGLLPALLVLLGVVVRRRPESESRG